MSLRTPYRQASHGEEVIDRFVVGLGMLCVAVSFAVGVRMLYLAVRFAVGVGMFCLAVLTVSALMLRFRRRELRRLESLGSTVSFQSAMGRF